MTVTLYYDPSKERPFKRDGGRVFVTSKGVDVPLNVGTNLIEDEVLEEIKKDTFFSKLIEFEALIVRKEEKPIEEELQPIPQAEALLDNPGTPATPVDPETTLENQPINSPAVPPATTPTGKTLKSLR